ncbi:MAG: hypothetical protein ACT4P6_01840 [Gemmatimonadaceae bacterium]
MTRVYSQIRYQSIAPRGKLGRRIIEVTITRDLAVLVECPVAHHIALDRATVLANRALDAKIDSDDRPRRRNGPDVEN